MKDLRDAFFDEIASFATNNPDVVILTTDMQVNSLVEFQNTHSDRFINVGVSEQNIINVAAGLASTGKKVIVFGILSFLTTRCYEQLKINICEMNLPVLIVGIGTGLSFSFDGTTHHSTTDISTVRQLPNIEIYNPICAESAVQVANKVLEFRSPTLVRLDKGIYPHFRGLTDIQIDQSFSQIEFSENIILASGTIAENMVQLLKQGSIQLDKFTSIGIVQVWPLSKVLEEILDTASRLIVIEENTQSGGIFSIISEYIARKNLRIETSHYCLDSSDTMNSGSRTWLLQQYLHYRNH